MKKYDDAHRKDVHFNKADWVNVKLQLYRQESVATRQS